MASSKPHRKRPDNADRAQSADVLPQEYENQMLAVYLRALRVRQWTKSLIVFATPLFAFNFTPASLSGSLLAFILFCFASSSFYLIDDIQSGVSDLLRWV